MKRLVILIGLLVISCDYFEKKRVSSQTIFEKEMQTITWDAVDEYPSFSNCDTVSEQQERKYCFESTILNHVNTYLSNKNIIVSQDVQDTIHVRLTIDNKGKIQVLNIDKNPETHYLIPEIDSLLKGSIATLPKIFPATKRGQQVNTEFVLPVVVFIE